jgi:hydrogenase maturation protein HypF
MNNISSANIHITGIVQGVGFRPFVYGLAIRLGLKGWVKNTSAGVEIQVDGTAEIILSFIRSLKSELPSLARIDSIGFDFEAPREFSSFEIINSESLVGAFQPISPDVSICPDCLRELLDPHDRRYRYPFINCTNCGPRFTIITDIPYDRSNTTMAPFVMCPDCAAEYNNPLNRRFHAQPVACPVCGPQAWLEAADGHRIAERNDAILSAQELLANGKIIAIKGLGGFHLACDALNIEAVSELRRRKLRVDKPFALMMPDLKTVDEQCDMNELERALLESRQRPIVLLQRRPGSPIVAEVAPNQMTIGVMLPYTPIHYLLFTRESGVGLHSFDIRPLVMTSGNLSDEPIATDNDEARLKLASLADAFLFHDRDIQTRCDDSVTRIPFFKENGRTVSKEEKIKTSIYFLRRSRGYAPDPLQLPFEVPELLATGPELKNTFCVTRKRYAFISHHIGDMENYETMQSFEEGVKHFERLFRINPGAIVCDFHPDYLSSRYAFRRSQQDNIPLIRVQHHHAHIAACMADNDLPDHHPVIGLAFDGTGYGEDGAIWGGEFLVADYAAYQRSFHLDYFPLPGGDAAIKRPARIALALLWQLGIDWDDQLAPVKDLCFEERQALRIQLERGLNTPRTSSMGRLFDAAAALAGLRQRVNYEAQAAIEFEAVLDPLESGAYLFIVRENLVDVSEAFRGLLEDVAFGVSIPRISARFHNGLVVLSRQVCASLRSTTGISEVALSGGVWQNMALLVRTVQGLRKDGFNVLIHHQIPANDGGLSLGQAMVGANRYGS